MAGFIVLGAEASLGCDDVKIGYDNNDDDDVGDDGDDVQIDDDFGSTDVDLVYDHNGNLTDDGLHKYVYDAWNRLVKVTRRVDAEDTVATYAYDGLNRRITRTVTNCGPEEIANDGGNDGLGNPTSRCHTASGCCAHIEYDANGNAKHTECWVCPLGGGDEWPQRLGNVPSPHWGLVTHCLDSIGYDANGRLDTINMCQERWSADSAGTREYHLTYDQLSRPTSFRMRTDEHAGSQGAWLDRQFDYLNYDEEGRLLQRLGPDGQTTTYTYDLLGRPKTVTRDSMSVTYTYDDAGRVTRVDYGNGAYILRDYDDANRLEQIQHYGPGPTLLYQLDYVWNLDNTLYSRLEADYTVTPATLNTVAFQYDNRHRLLQETRTLDGDPDVIIYDIEYTYDQLGNRETKADTVSGLSVEYTYDVELDSEDMDYPTCNNRLLYYEVSDQSQRLLRTVSYTYYEGGHVSNVSIKDKYHEGVTPGDEADYDWVNDLALYYDPRSAPRVVLWDRWQLDANGDPDTGTYEQLHAREFRYEWLSGGMRARYMTVDYDPTNEAQLPNQWPIIEPVQLTDYAGVSPYQDATITPDGQGGWSAPVDTKHYLFPAADRELPGGAEQYYHGDLIDSTVMTTDGSGSSVSSVAYTAFGELVTGYSELDTRYQYAGAYGYESGLVELSGANSNLPALTFQHVGWRWYQPDTGRFLQRDPIGIWGGLNVYTYCGNAPSIVVDPNGKLLLVLGIIVAGGILVAWGIKGCVIMQNAGNTPLISVDETLTDQGRAYPHGAPLYDWGYCIGELAKSPGTSAQGPCPPGLPTNAVEGAGVLINEGIGNSGVLDPSKHVDY